MIMIILVLVQNSIRKAFVFFLLFMLVLYHLFGALDHFMNLIKARDPLYSPFKLMQYVNQQISLVFLVDSYIP